MSIDEFEAKVKSYIRLRETHDTHLRLERHTWGTPAYPAVELHLTDGVSTAACDVRSDGLSDDYARHLAEFLVTRWAHQRLTDTWLPLTIGEWLAAVPVIVRQLPPEQHLRFLVRLLTSLQRSGVDMSEHWDCLLEALVEEMRR